MLHVDSPLFHDVICPQSAVLCNATCWQSAASWCNMSSLLFFVMLHVDSLLLLHDVTCWVCCFFVMLCVDSQLLRDVIYPQSAVLCNATCWQSAVSSWRYMSALCCFSTTYTFIFYFLQHYFVSLIKAGAIILSASNQLAVCLCCIVWVAGVQYPFLFEHHV